MWNDWNWLKRKEMYKKVTAARNLFLGNLFANIREHESGAKLSLIVDLFPLTL